MLFRTAIGIIFGIVIGALFGFWLVMSLVSPIPQTEVESVACKRPLSDLDNRNDLTVTCVCEVACDTCSEATRTIPKPTATDCEYVSPTPTPDDTPTPNPTDTPGPTDTPEPEPTNTPEPTDTPEPEPTIKCDQGRGNGDDGCSPGNSDHRHSPNDPQKGPRR